MDIPLYLVILLAAYCSLVTALPTNITLQFHVIHALDHQLGQNEMAVSINNKLYPLDNKNTQDPLIYAGQVSSPDALQYQYVILDEKGTEIEREPFSRTIDYVPMFDFYGRQPTVQTDRQQRLPLVQFTEMSANVYNHPGNPDQVHPINEIPTLHVQADIGELQKLHDGVLEDILITANLSRIRDSNKRTLDGYKRFKLRSCATDPSYMREKLYYDILAASQVPTARASYVRLFINQEPQGLYMLVDKYKEPFSKKVFGNDQPDYKRGTLFQGSMQENPMAVGRLRLGANLGYLGPTIKDYVEPEVNQSVYKIQEYPSKSMSEDQTMASLVSFIQFIESTKTFAGTKEELAVEWNKKLDVPTFLKNLALEIILGHNDGYLGEAHNYLLYQDPGQNGRFIWLPSDLDQTFGNTLVPANEQENADNSFKRVDQFGLLNNIARRPLVSQLLQVDEFRDQWFRIIQDYYNYLFKSDTVLTYTNYLKMLIQTDVQWDKQLQRVNRFQGNQSVFQNQLRQKILQLPLGGDFYERIDKIDFDMAINGTIVNHSSIVSITGYLSIVNQSLSGFVLDLKSEGLL
ncbi:hypothetical protein G6F70_002724 [Rhizopus microsporus]|nr:hypothetical protein G6F71_003905 [Rhizopus microsporus]KAG1201905.1 hypothetical protein G6F70_002724 [Rhizopus microsporus]KAG1210518.1 hypothetical protein G6F69_005404 [Rhizopus microsporus]KAG1232210.1 hypothetical protein G6F67_005177 [Rhizopus microsporus]KAG1264381.1 hypothetical protein G6F68_004386 [Rhizopus microsporus]